MNHVARNPGTTPLLPRAITLRPLWRQNIPFGLRLSHSAGWNQTEADWKLIVDQGSAGNLVACIDGVDVGTVTVITHAERFYWLGMLLVAPEFRRRGIGRALLKSALNRVDDGCPVFLDATPAGKELYDQSGFQEVYGFRRCLRHPESLGITPGDPCQPITETVLPAVLDYDEPIFGANRSWILTELLQRAPQLAFYTRQGTKLAGYCLGRVGHHYTQVGPLAADDLVVARDLLLAVLLHHSQDEVILDAPFHQPGWNQLLVDLGFTELRPFTRMVLGESTLPKEHVKQLAIAGPEWG
jgi:GNAT superfamily N-acetyltransferase